MEKWRKEQREEKLGRMGPEERENELAWRGRQERQ